MAVVLSVIVFLAGALVASVVPESTALGLNALGYVLMLGGVVALAASLAATRSN